MTFADVKPLAVLILISLMGGGTLFGVFKKMQRGFGPIQPSSCRNCLGGHAGCSTLCALSGFD